ncbi:ParB/RepB/Spo0J family partition protein [Leptothrix discophora]|uniref:ParB/RepB/Spo0J family partition protein n=1 Tax=Leptothrix discophora TaxID=89 RepID=A0ABT9G273_LEPDI|nr:ParB/RepB/Spo0J family partition protein [Leptothrix discophora]MDP4300377.1 ParB/RepB/Spo0J family partition protein [Leptothrix discophora]
MTTETLQRLPLSLLIDSPSNPRRSYPDLQELADNIQANGLLQPIVVREVRHSTGHEIVFGHCRVRAARLAGLDEIDCLVREMSDDEVAIAQLSENAARADVHPIEEADALARLMADHGLTIEALMRRTGKSRTAIYNRLKLATLTPEARDACQVHGIGAEIATLISRVPAALQMRAVSRVVMPQTWPGPGQPVAMPHRQAKEALKSGFTRALSEADFDPAEHYVNCDGPCTNCPRNSTVEPALAELGADVCTDIACHEARTRAAMAERIEQARSEGRVIDTLDDHTDLCDFVRYDSGRSVHVQDLVDEARSRGETLTIYLLLSEDGTDPDECIRDNDLERLKAARWPEIYGTAKPDDDDDTDAAGADATVDADDDEEDTDLSRTPIQAALIAHWARVQGAIIAKVRSTPRTPDDLRLMLRREVELVGNLGKAADELGLSDRIADLDDDADTTNTYVQLIDEMSADDLAAALVIIAVEDLPVSHTPCDLRLAQAQALAERYGVDPLAIAAQVEQDQQAQATKAHPVKYRHPTTGETWSGRGLKPRWLVQALDEGMTLDECEVRLVDDRTIDMFGAATGSAA